MRSVKYVGAANRKEFDADSLKRHGVEDQHKVVFTDDKPVQEVSDATWEWLNSDASTEKGNFVLVDEDGNTIEDGSESTSAVADTGDVESGADPAPGAAGTGAAPKAGRTGRGSSTAGTTG